VYVCVCERADRQCVSQNEVDVMVALLEMSPLCSNGKADSF